MNEEYISLEKLIDTTSNIENIKIDNIKIDNIKIDNTLVNLYQIQGTQGKAGGIIKYIGKDTTGLVIIIHRFKFKKYLCKIISYILSDVDINIANDKCMFKILGLLIECDGEVVAVIILSFYTFTHKKEKSNITNYISNSNNIILPGFYGYELKHKNIENIEESEMIGNTFKLFPGRTKSIYNLIDLLSNDKLLFLY